MQRSFNPYVPCVRLLIFETLVIKPLHVVQEIFCLVRSRLQGAFFFSVGRRSKRTYMWKKKCYNSFRLCVGKCNLVDQLGLRNIRQLLTNWKWLNWKTKKQNFWFTLEIGCNTTMFGRTRDFVGGRSFLGLVQRRTLLRNSDAFIGIDSFYLLFVWGMQDCDQEVKNNLNTIW